MLSKDEKVPYLVELLRRTEEPQTIIFCNSEAQALILATWLKKMKISAQHVLEDFPSDQKEDLIANFKSGNVANLVTNDFGLKGLKITQVNLVINFEIPRKSHHYKNRANRLKNSPSAKVVNFCGPDDGEFLDAVESLLGSKIAQLHIEDDDLALDVCPQPEVDVSHLQKKKGRDRDRDNKKPKRESNRTRDGKNTERKPRDSKKEVKEKKPMPVKKPKKFEVTSSSLEDAQKEALEYFEIDDVEKLQWDVLKEGKKSFLFFGKNDVTYQFSLKPADHDELGRETLSFLRELVLQMNLDLDVEMGSDPETLTIDISGEDVGLVLCNKKQLLFALDLVTKQAMTRAGLLSRGVSIYLNAIGTNPPKEPSERSHDRKRRGGRRDQRRSRNNEFSEEVLINMAKELKERVIETGEPQTTKTLHPADRRLIHQFLENDKEVQTTSLGDGRFKKIEVSRI